LSNRYNFFNKNITVYFKATNDINIRCEIFLCLLKWLWNWHKHIVLIHYMIHTDVNKLVRIINWFKKVNFWYIVGFFSTPRCNTHWMQIHTIGYSYLNIYQNLKKMINSFLNKMNIKFLVAHNFITIVKIVEWTIQVTLIHQIRRYENKSAADKIIFLSIYCENNFQQIVNCLFTDLFMHI
jgi:hypothetical protein